MMIRWIVAMWSMVVMAAAYDGPKDKLHVYVLMGGAEMAGTQPVTEQDAGIVDRCYLLNDKGEWEPAKAPLNRYSSLGGERAGLGPGTGFARRMLELNPDVSIGLVVCAAPDSLIEDWTVKSAEYRQARKLARIAAKTGTLRGVLWQHQKSHSTLPLDDMMTMIAYFRSDMDLLNLPVVVGEVPFDGAMNVQLAELTQRVHATERAKISGAASAKTKQMEPRGAIVQGERFADAMMELHAVWDKRGDRKPVSDIGIVDPHIHAFANKPGGLDPLAKWMERNHIEHAVVSPIGASRARTEEQRKVELANFEKYRGKIHRFCLAEPGEFRGVEDLVEVLEKEKQLGAVAFGEHYGNGMMFDATPSMMIYAACEKVGLPVMFHIDQNKNMDGFGLPRVERVLKTYPNCKLVAHAWWWLHLPYGTCDRQLSEHPNLYADISGLAMNAMLNRDRGYTREFLIRHQDRILFGSDAGWWSFDEDPVIEQQFRILEELDLPDEVRRKIYRENAIKLFGLE